MRSKRPTTRSLAVVLAAGFLSLALAASAGAIVYVYGNGFGSKAAFKEISRSGGGNDCGKRYRNRSDSMRVSIRGQGFCQFTPPVFGDSSQPDHAIVARGKVLTKKTPKNLRRGAFLGVRLRVGGGNHYEFMVKPRKKRFKLVRSPRANDFKVAGRSRAINGLRERQKLRLVVNGRQVTASVNGTRVARTVDPNHERLDGRKVSFGVGSTRSSNGKTVAAFDSVRVGVIG